MTAFNARGPLGLRNTPPPGRPPELLPEVEIENSQRAVDHAYIARVPEGERERIRQISQATGFEDKPLEQIVDDITANRELWVRIMLAVDTGLQNSDRDKAVPGTSIFRGVRDHGQYAAAGLHPQRAVTNYLVRNRRGCGTGLYCRLSVAALPC